MRNIILSEWISLDGYVSDKNGQLNFFGPLVRKTYAEPDQEEFLSSIDTILMGRKTYELFEQVWPGRSVEDDQLAATMNKVKKIVASNTLLSAPWGEWPAAEVASGDVTAQIKALKALEGKDILLWASISLGQQLMKEGLIDQYQLFLCPELTGGGRRLFTNETSEANLKLIDARRYDSGVVCMYYEPRISAG